MDKHPIDIILEKGIFRGWRISQNSFLMASDRSVIERGEFGHIAAYICDHCGPIDEPECVCTYRGCGFESWSGPEEAEYEDRCPECGRLECCGENENPNRGFKRVRAWRVAA